MNIAIKASLITAGFALCIFVESGTRDKIPRMEYEFGQVHERIDRLENWIDRVETRIDRVETKVDEVRGYLKINVDAATNDAPPVDVKKWNILGSGLGESKASWTFWQHAQSTSISIRQ